MENKFLTGKYRTALVLDARCNKMDILRNQLSLKGAASAPKFLGRLESH